MSIVAMKAWGRGQGAERRHLIYTQKVEGRRRGRRKGRRGQQAGGKGNRGEGRGGELGRGEGNGRESSGYRYLLSNPHPVACFLPQGGIS